MPRKSFPSFSRIFASIVTVVVFFHGIQAQTPFSRDSAYIYLQVIAGNIGPRPMGSPSERAAMAYAVSKFREFGLQEAFIMPIRETASTVVGAGVNTNSGIAVGVLKGKGERVIVIGGHIDSAGPDIPGANDDGSGSATVLELARVLSQRANESTMVFALFGGEEHGLVGSHYFVKHFDRMEHVALMLQIDMTNGSDWLLPLIGSGDRLSPEWLVRAAFEEFDKLGYTGFSYPTHFYSLLETAPGGGIGSDHEPFLQKGIPAIDFTSDVTDPIHTPQDNLQNFLPEGLKRSGDLVYRLVERFDGGVPDEPAGSYYLLQFGTFLFFIPPLFQTFLVVLAVGGAVYSILEMRKRRSIEEPLSKVPGFKMFLLMLIIQTCVWLSENVVGLITGRRFPWLSEPDGYFVLGFLGGVVGIWISLQLVPKLNLTRVAYRYALRSMAFLVIFLAGFSLISPKLAVYPAVAIVLLGTAFLLRNQYLRLLVWLISPLFMFRLIFSEGFYLFARSITQAPAEGATSFFLHFFYVLFFSVWSFPFLLGFAAVYADSSDRKPWLHVFARPVGGMAAAAAFLLWTAYLSTVPAYSDLWQQKITVEQSVNLNTGKGVAGLSSSDYLHGAEVRVAGKDTSLDGRETRVRLATFDASGHEWVKVEREVTTRGTTNTMFDIRLRVHTKHRPYSLKVTFTGGNSTPTDITTPLVWSPGPRSVSFHWYSFPDTSLFLPVSFTIVGSDSVVEYVEATFLEQPMAVSVQKDHASIISRTTVIRESSYGGIR